MGTWNRHNVLFLESASLKKKKREAMARIKQNAKIFKKKVTVTSMKKKKKSCLLVPKVVIDLPFEGRLKEAGNTEEGSSTGGKQRGRNYH